jgi:hypothetical protein
MVPEEQLSATFICSRSKCFVPRSYTAETTRDACQSIPSTSVGAAVRPPELLRVNASSFNFQVSGLWTYNSSNGETRLSTFERFGMFIDSILALSPSKEGEGTRTFASSSVTDPPVLGDGVPVVRPPELCTVS